MINTDRHTNSAVGALECLAQEAHNYSVSQVKDNFSDLPNETKERIFDICRKAYIDGVIAEKQDWIEWCNSLSGMTCCIKCFDLLFSMWLRLKNLTKG